MTDVVFMTGGKPTDTFPQMLWSTRLSFVPEVGQYVEPPRNNYGGNRIFIVAKVTITGQAMRYGIYSENQNDVVVICQVEIVK